MKSSCLLIFFLISYFIHSSTINAQDLAQQRVLKIPKPRTAFDISHDYHLTLLNMALVAAAKGRAIPKFEILTKGMSQGRASIELMRGEMVDVYWLGSDQETDDKLRAIKIPTTRGLIGYRKFIIKRESLAAFEQVKSVEDLKKFVACQGTHWPDTKILAQAQLPVIGSTIYENLFKMLDAKRCDYFPRAYHDIENELLNIKALYPDLIEYERILLHYPFAVYFYTNKSNEDLARWIEEGLEVLSSKGDIEKLMKEHPLTSHIFPLIKETHTLYLPINNALLAPNTKTTNQQYWFLPEDFGIDKKIEE